MNIHKNARTTPRSRAMLIQRVLIERLSIAQLRIQVGERHQRANDPLPHVRMARKTATAVDITLQQACRLCGDSGSIAVPRLR
ncbi:hypothetical protein GPROT1_03128 [Gammaproteobacteria bacterium]|nr:hypothetical protein GPROT1_03128 [Gammaproteobacteria bacterium]